MKPLTPLIAVLSLFFALSACTPQPTKPSINPNLPAEEVQKVTDLANAVFAAIKANPQLMQTAGVKFEDGFCLANILTQGWSADLVHNPRQPVDDLPANQCSSYLDGTTQHLIELDIEGNMVRML